MNSYDDIAALTSKISQEELNFQTFNEKAVTTTSSWALLNELLHGGPAGAFERKPTVLNPVAPS